jgi:hypothetical protein
MKGKEIFCFICSRVQMGTQLLGVANFLLALTGVCERCGT